MSGEVIQVSLTPVEGGATVLYNMELPSTILSRVTHIEEDDKASIEAALLNDEIGFQIDEENLVAKFNNVFYSLPMQASSGSVLKKKLVEIGPWNMDDVTTLTIPNGFADSSKIRGINAIVTSDSSDDWLKIDHWNGSGVGGYVVSNGSDIIIGRENGGQFNNPSYSSTAFNRGYVLIDYVE